jgi:antitoxin StbD
MMGPILSDLAVDILELKKNPMAVVEAGEGMPVAILNGSQPVFYCVPAEAYEALINKLEDIELIAFVDACSDQDEVEINVDSL